MKGMFPGPHVCESCHGEGGRLERGGPGDCLRCGRFGGRTRVYRWSPDAPNPLTEFPNVADALAAAAFATDLPAGCDTLHLHYRSDGAVSVVASSYYGEPCWLVPR